MISFRDSNCACGIWLQVYGLLAAGLKPKGKSLLGTSSGTVKPMRMEIIRRLKQESPTKWAGLQQSGLVG